MKSDDMATNSTPNGTENWDERDEVINEIQESQTYEDSKDNSEHLTNEDTINCSYHKTDEKDNKHNADCKEEVLLSYSDPDRCSKCLEACDSPELQWKHLQFCQVFVCAFCQSKTQNSPLNLLNHILVKHTEKLEDSLSKCADCKLKIRPVPDVVHHLNICLKFPLDISQLSCLFYTSHDMDL